MKFKLLVPLFCLSIFSCYSQNLSIPDSTFNKLVTKIFFNNLDTTAFQIVFPKNYDSTLTYPVFLALSGGNQSLEIVNYCYAVWFNSAHFNQHITILPIAESSNNLRNYESQKIIELIQLIQTNFMVTKANWTLGGTSNGGVAAFNFLNVSPELFKTVIVMPGSIDQSLTLSNELNHIDILLAYGTKDNKEWKKAIKYSQKILKHKVNSVKTIKLKGMGHILPLSFPIDTIYNYVFRS